MSVPHRVFNRLQPWMIVGLISLVYLSLIFIVNEAEPLVFVMPGTRFSAGDPTGTEGYDGQFAYYIARDPSNAAQHIDVPAYRYQRILLPMLARIISLGEEYLIPWAMLAINLSALLISTALLGRILKRHRTSHWYALVYGLFPGILMAVRLGLNEPLAYGLVIGALWLIEQDRIWQGFAVLALAALGKETTLLFAGGLSLSLIIQRRYRIAVIGGALVILPFTLWQLVLYQWFGALGIGSGGALATPFEIIPFNGFFRIYVDTGSFRVFLVFALLLIPAVIVPTLWGVWQAIRDMLQKRTDEYTWLLIANAVVMPFVPFSTYREPLGILRFIVGLVICVLIYAAARHQKRVLRYSTLWLVLLAIVVNSG